MTETASGLCRVFVLLVASSVFAVAWSGDQQVQEQFIIARKAAADRQRQMLLADGPTPAPTVAVVTDVEQRASKRPLRDCHQQLEVTGTASFVARVEIEMTLPYGIGGGRYQVVDQSGATQTIHVSTSDHPVELQDVYLLERPDGTRQFFIRLIDVAESPESASIR